MFSKYVTKRNKTEIQVEDIEKAVDAEMKNDRNLREEAALFNP